MSVTQATRFGAPSAGVTSSLSLVAPFADVDVDAFRGVFIDLVDHATQKAHDAQFFLDEKADSELDWLLKPKSDSGPKTYTYASGAGLYGDGCLSVNCSEVQFTTDYATNNRQMLSPGHGLANHTLVQVNNIGGALPTGVISEADFEKQQFVVNVDANSFELSYDQPFTASNDSGDLLFTDVDHGLSEDDTVRFSQGILPTGVSRDTDYWVIASGLTSSTFKLSVSQGGGAIAYTDSGLGTLRYYCASKGVTFTNDGTGTHAVTPTGLSGFWLGRGYKSGTAVNFREGTGTEKYLGPASSRPYNRFEFYIKYPAGYREQYSQFPATTHNKNHVIGLYHADSASTNEETNGYHFYIHQFVRHDLADGDWVRIKLAEHVNHMRDAMGDANYAPDVICRIADEGTLWDTETRLYMDGINYGGSAELGTSYAALYDRMRIYYEDNPLDMSAAWDTIDKRELIYCEGIGGAAIDFWFTITNNEASPVTGHVRIGTHTSNTQASVYDSVGTLVTDQITVPASGTWQGYFRYHPNVRFTSGSYPTSVSFTPLSQRNDDLNSNTGEKSFSDSRVEWRYQNVAGGSGAGPLDGFFVGVSFVPQFAQRITFDGSTNEVSLPGHLLTTASTCYLKLVDAGDTLPTELSEAVLYKVFSPNTGAGTFKLSTDGISEIDFTGNGTTSSGYFWVYR